MTTARPIARPRVQEDRTGHSSVRRPIAAAVVAALALVPLPGASASPGPTAASGEPAPGGPGAGDPYFPLYGNGGYDAVHYDLDVRYDPQTDVLRGEARLRARATQELSTFNLDLVGLTVRSVTVDGQSATWSRRAGHQLVVRPARVLRRDASFSVAVRYDGVPRRIDDPLLGTYGFLPTPDGALAVGEPEVAAFWYPVNDHPEDKATYRISITAPRGLQALSNGLPQGRTESGRWATTTWRERHPMASYLAFLAVGHFDVHRWRTSDGLPVIDAVDSGITGPLRRRIDASLARQGEILRAEERWFGPYPFEAAGGVIDDLEIGFALENQTRPVYSPVFWDIPDVPTAGDDVVVHELAHQWYGDSVALHRWRDIWLNEGFATYAEWLWREREFGFTPREVFDSLYDIPADDPFWRLRIGDPGPERLFVGQVYVRGAMTLQALRMTVGSRDFFRILHAWAREHRDGNGTTAQFVALAERIAGRPLQQLFHDWLYTSAKPTRPAAPTASAARRAQVDTATRDWLARFEAYVARHRSHAGR